MRNTELYPEINLPNGAEARNLGAFTVMTMFALLLQGCGGGSTGNTPTTELPTESPPGNTLVIPPTEMPTPTTEPTLVPSPTTEPTATREPTPAPTKAPKFPEKIKLPGLDEEINQIQTAEEALDRISKMAKWYDESISGRQDTFLDWWTAPKTQEYIAKLQKISGYGFRCGRNMPPEGKNYFLLLLYDVNGGSLFIFLDQNEENQVIYVPVSASEIDDELDHNKITVSTPQP